MSSVGRGRGYSGRHHLRDHRPGEDFDAETDAARTLAELSPRSTDPTRMEVKEKTESEKEMPHPTRVEVKEKMESEEPEKVIDESDVTLKELLRIDEQYVPLLTLLEQFSPGEDGIQFNRKLRHFETTVTNMCPDETRLHSAFATFRAAALRSAVSARKLAAVGASFTRQQRQQLLRGALLNVVMQGTFSKLDVLERSNPLFLINAANLMGDYFAEARLCNGNKVHILASPLLQYLRALLTSDDLRAHRSLATQLMQNGRELLSVLAQELDELSISIRLRLLSPPPISTIWLLLSADLCLNKFLPLPNTLQQFYAAHLELTTEENYSEVSYGSWKNTPEKDEFRPDTNQDSNDKVSVNLSQISLNNHDDSKPKLRPILGAGAGLLRQEQAFSVSQDNFETWTPKNSLNKRYDLNSWRQQDGTGQEDNCPEVEFTPTILPPNFNELPPNFNELPPTFTELPPNFTELPPNFTELPPNFTELPPNFTELPPNFNELPPNFTDYPPPRFNYPDNFPNYLQQGDGAYIQNQYTNVQFNSQGDSFPSYPPQEQTTSLNTERSAEHVTTDRVTPNLPQMTVVNNEIQKNSARRPVENWRKEKGDLKEDPSRSRQRNWTRQKSKENISDGEEQLNKDNMFIRTSRDSRADRMNRRSSGEDPFNKGGNGANGSSEKTPPRRHVTEVPRSAKYWDHDDRCDKDYNS